MDNLKLINKFLGKKHSLNTFAYLLLINYYIDKANYVLAKKLLKSTILKVKSASYNNLLKQILLIKLTHSKETYIKKNLQSVAKQIKNLDKDDFILWLIILILPEYFKYDIKTAKDFSAYFNNLKKESQASMYNAYNYFYKAKILRINNNNKNANKLLNNAEKIAKKLSLKPLLIDIFFEKYLLTQNTAFFKQATTLAKNIGYLDRLRTLKNNTNT